MKQFLLLGICLFSLPGWALTAKLSSDEIKQGQSVELIISSEDYIPKVDFTPLSKDFMLAGQSTAQSNRFINGVGTTTYERSIVLFPLKEGKVEIPPLKVGSETTPVLTLNVQKKDSKDAENSGPTQPADVSIKAELSEENLYIGQNAFYTVSVENSDELANAEIIPPAGEGIKLSPLGQDIAKIKNNRQVIERTFVLKPEKTGKLTLSPAVLNGEVFYRPQNQIHGKGLFSLFNSAQIMSTFNSGVRPIQVISNTIPLNIKPKPQDWEGWWLPTSKVNLTMVPTIPPNLKTGDTFQCHFTLEALNVDANDLPVPKLPTDKRFRYYPGLEERHTSILPDGNMKSSVAITYTIMPLEAGAQTLPDVNIPWFDIKSKTRKIARATPLTLNIDTGNVEPVIKPAEPVLPQKSPEESETEKLPALPGLFWLYFSGAFVVGILIGIGCFFLIKKKAPAKKKEKPIPDFYPF